jgi:16S rRNA processing protein RimM
VGPSELEIGVIVRPHGLKGEVVVRLVSDRVERLAAGTVLSCRVGGREATLAILSSRPHQHRFLVLFEGVTSREGAEQLRDGVLYGPPIEDPDALFVHQLIGCEVIEHTGRARGRVVAVQANPASDLLVLESGALVPLRFVAEHRDGVIAIEAPEGIFDL